MLQRKAFKTELDPNDKDKTFFKKCCGTYRFAYNWGLSRNIDEYKTTGKSAGAIEQHRQLNELKADELAWMYDVPKEVPQEALRNKDKALRRFFENLKAVKSGKAKKKCKNPYGFPKFRSKKRGIGSFTLRNSIHIRPLQIKYPTKACSLKKSEIKIPRLGWVNLKEKGYLPLTEDGAGDLTGVRIISITISEKAGRWYVSVHVEIEVDPNKVQKEQPLSTAGELVTHVSDNCDSENQGLAVGIDMGLKTFGTLVQDDGLIVTIISPKPLKASLKKLKRASKHHSRCLKGSRNRKKSSAKLARLHAKIANQRYDFLQQYSTAVVLTYDIIGVENLNLIGMMKLFGRSTADTGWGAFVRMLEYKCKWCGKVLVKTDKFFPSSKKCSRCGNIKKDLSLSDRTYHCDNCGLTIDRDVNAAVNLIPFRVPLVWREFKPDREDGSGIVAPEQCETVFDDAGTYVPVNAPETAGNRG